MDAWSWSLRTNDASPLLDVSTSRKQPCDGCAALDKELQRLGSTGESHEKIAHASGFPKLEDFYAALGRDEVLPTVPGEPALVVATPGAEPVAGGPGCHMSSQMVTPTSMPPCSKSWIPSPGAK